MLYPGIFHPYCTDLLARHTRIWSPPFPFHKSHIFVERHHHLQLEHLLQKRVHDSPHRIPGPFFVPVLSMPPSSSVSLNLSHQPRGRGSNIPFNCCSNFLSFFSFFCFSRRSHSLSSPSGPPHFFHANSSTWYRTYNIMLANVDLCGFALSKWGRISSSRSSGSVSR